MLGCSSVGLHDQQPSTLHLIVICDNNDTFLRKGFEMNHFHINRIADTIAKRTALHVNKILFSGARAHSDTIRTFLKQFKCTSNDVILFQYSGHGVNRSWSGVYPAFLLPPYQHLLTVNELELSFALHKPRLMILLSDCCNVAADDNVIPAPTGKISENAVQREVLGTTMPSAQDYKQLFLKTSGIIKITAAQKGQVAYTHEYVGGILTTVFSDMLQNACATTGKDAGWERFTQEVVQNTEETALYFGKVQKPYFQILIRTE
jgi:hypothetical protein